MRKIRFALCLLAALCLTAGCGARAPKKWERQVFYFDTVVQLSFYAGKDGAKLMDGCLQICQRLQKTFDRTDAESELYAINHRTKQELDVSEDMAKLIAVGLQYYELSGGSFDITVAPLLELWDFKSEDGRVPDAADIREACAAVDAGAVHLNGRTLTFDRPDTMLDLGALVKGYAADLLKEYLVSGGVSSGLLDLGGNVLTIGEKPDGSAWRIGVQKPFAARGETAAILNVSDQCLVSSGIYERYFEQDGRIYHHILDPATGYPAENRVQGVSILCASALTGDALSTTCLALGEEKGPELIARMDGAEAVFVLDDGELLFTDESLKEQNGGR